jgi:hypothetical protein
MTDLPQFDRKRHGSLFDRGSADAYYRALPHLIGIRKEPAVENAS